jgi:betaine-aldehyde dehydrogenase
MSVIAYDTVDEAIAIANDSEYGLHGGVFTTDLERGLDVARQIETGTITINSYSTNPSAPFGGVKNSGIGREHGPEGIGAFLETKSYVIPQALFTTLSERMTPWG